jgi:hypothetical protein
MSMEPKGEPNPLTEDLWIVSVSGITAHLYRAGSPESACGKLGWGSAFWSVERRKPTRNCCEACEYIWNTLVSVPVSGEEKSA